MANTFNAQTPTVMQYHDDPQMFTQGWPHENSTSQYNASQNYAQGQGKLMEPQNRGF